MLQQLYYLNKLRRFLGMKGAIKAFIPLRITKTGKVKVSFVRHPFRIRLNNIADSATFNEVILRQEYELDPSFTPKRIIDGGGNIGLTSIYFASRFPEADIVSVEPASNNFELLSDNIAPYPKVKGLQSAIWSTSTHLHLVDLGIGENAYRVEETNADNPEAFKAMSIKDIMNEQGWDGVDILKLDIEGSEKEVFAKGFEEWIPKTKILIVETHDRLIKGTSQAVFKTMAQYNFTCRLRGFNFVFYNDDLLEK